VQIARPAPVLFHSPYNQRAVCNRTRIGAYGPQPRRTVKAKAVVLYRRQRSDPTLVELLQQSGRRREWRIERVRATTGQRRGHLRAREVRLKMTEQTTPAFKPQSRILEITSQGWFTRAQPHQAGGRRAERRQQSALHDGLRAGNRRRGKAGTGGERARHGCGIGVTDA
jgi:hypothetical protein